MKKVIFIIFLLGLGPLLYSQNIHFVDPKSVWYFVGISYNGNLDNPPEYYPSKYSIGKDTIIAGKNYNKLLKGNPLYSYGQTIGFLREDSLKRIYFLYKEYNDFCSTEQDLKNEEFLVYDFGAKSGDTISNEKIIQFSVVGQIDSVLVGSNYRMRIEIYSPVTSGWDYWIEGIGSTRRLFYPLICPFEYMEYLTCFEYDGEVIYPTDAHNQCIVTEFNNTNIEEILVYPNPSNSGFTIEFSNLTGEKQFYVWDVLGKLIFSDNTTEDYYQLASLKNTGIYNLQIIDNSQNIFSKIIIVEK